MVDPTLAHAPLGQEVRYPASYDSGLLFPIARQTARQALSVLPAWTGADIWNAYELAWLNPRGKPVAAMARFVFSQESPNLIESKSFKLYLNSFNEERLSGPPEVERRLRDDLSRAAGAPVQVKLMRLDDAQPPCQPLRGESLDEADIEIDAYRPKPGLLRCMDGAARVTETLTSDLLKSNCPVTGQPDWGSVLVHYTGPRIDRHALLRYIVSLRRHDEFHEHCVEKMYCDIWQACRPESLLVYARYTRRGGLDINPWRASDAALASMVSLARTVRQ